MAYRLFIDDERDAALKDGESMVIARNFDEAISIMHDMGCPTFISFDHDLGPDEKTGHDIAKWIVNQDMNEMGLFIPKKFNFYVHSQNPIGKANIEGLLENYLMSKECIYAAGY